MFLLLSKEMFDFRQILGCSRLTLSTNGHQFVSVRRWHSAALPLAEGKMLRSAVVSPERVLHCWCCFCFLKALSDPQSPGRF